MIRLVALACGLMCGAGFLISGLYDPALVVDIPKREGGPLAFGLALFASVFVASLLATLRLPRQAPLLGGEEEPLPVWKGRTALVSAALFGVGWGLSGYVPLTALVSAGALSPGGPIFLISALVGMVLVDVVTGQRPYGGGGKGSVG